MMLFSFEDNCAYWLNSREEYNAAAFKISPAGRDDIFELTRQRRISNSKSKVH